MTSTDEEQVRPPESAPANIPVTPKEFDTAEHASSFGHTIAYAVREISRYINLERLDGITVAFDYDQALADVDGGFDVSRPLRRTSDDKLIGVAMAVPVLRDSTPKSHLVFHAPT